jgi:hypothetical protein
LFCLCFVFLTRACGTTQAYGLSALPIGLIKGKKHISEDVAEVQSNLGKTKEQKKALQSKYLNSKKLSKKDKSKMDLLERQERCYPFCTRDKKKKKMEEEKEKSFLPEFSFAELCRSRANDWMPPILAGEPA